MIVNENTGSHDIYLPDRKIRVRANRRTPSDVATENCRGSLEEKLAWMRARQAAKRTGRIPR